MSYGDQDRRYLIKRSNTLSATSWYKPRIWPSGFPKVEPLIVEVSGAHFPALVLPLLGKLTAMLKSRNKCLTWKCTHWNFKSSHIIWCFFLLCSQGWIWKSRCFLSPIWDHGMLLKSGTCVGRTKFQMGENTSGLPNLLREVCSPQKRYDSPWWQASWVATKCKSECPLTDLRAMWKRNCQATPSSSFCMFWS